MQEFDGKLAFITGGASGIGLAIARALGRRGATLLLADVDEAGLRDSRHQLEKEGHRVETYRCDVSDPEHLLKIAQQIDAAHGGLDILINNAGVSTGGSAGSVPPVDWHWIVNINLLGVVWGTNAFVPLLMKRGKGSHIVNTGSMASHWANPMLGPYNATKFAVAGYTETLRQELEPQGINVSLLCPGFARTDIHKSSLNRPSVGEDKTETIESGVYQMASSMIEAGMDPDLIGELVAWGILNKKFYLFSHPEFRPAIELRHQSIQSDYQACTEWLETHSAIAS